MPETLPLAGTLAETPAPPDRARAARDEIAKTVLAPRAGRTLVAVFALMLVAPPVVELALGDRLRLPNLNPDPAAPAPSGVVTRTVNAIVTGNRRLLETIHIVQTAIDQDLELARVLRPFVQYLLTGALGAGNERVYPGARPWLFYRVGMDYVLGPGFLEPALLARRTRDADEWVTPPQPDPRPAIRQFHAALQARGIALVLVPAPTKATVHPEPLGHGGHNTEEMPQNASFATLVRELADNGILVFDPAPVLRARAVETGASQYLATDSHWRPEAMALVAERLADVVRRHVALPDAPRAGYSAAETMVEHSGDLLAMLALPPFQQLYPRERVLIRQIREIDGTLWRPSREADVLLLGDSFSNIYALASMGWGEAAGFAEQLSYALQRPVDRIVQNDDGAFATRAMLAREHASRGDRLAGKRLVIWQFAARELASGDWRLIGLLTKRP